MNETDRENLMDCMLKLLPSYNHCFKNFSYLRSMDLTKTHLKILIILKQHGKMTMSELADFLSASREQTTRAVAPLAAKGFINRTVSEENRRNLNVDLTESGNQFLCTLRKKYMERFITKFEKLSEGEMYKFISSLDIIVNTLDKLSG